MFRPKSQTELLILSITKNVETLIKQTDAKPQETLELKLARPKEPFSLKPPHEIEECWMIGIPSLEIYKFIFNITEQNNNFDFFTDCLDEFLLTELKDEVAKIFGFQNLHPNFYNMN